ncbi:hypothetical protein [Sphingobacterium detergens]|uniref:Uncharacterized protein n=1 Tax=Sphingobacterium detergens TaxID=1145106 RepID=A0A420B7M3_SPHD1|nr:hypothetical protein [Sphingobacterium detergens]RKE52652.1 hypothetical protein DFQ12_2894 [Sphingobacterium detergens]
MERFITANSQLNRSTGLNHQHIIKYDIISKETQSMRLMTVLMQPKSLTTITSQRKDKTNSQRMNTLYYSFIMSFLKENHPEILKSIDKIYEPDLSKISQVIDCYCEFMGIPSQQIMGEYINYKDIQHRYKAIAVVLRIFQPEKLDNLKAKVKSTIYKELGPYLKINSDTLQKSIICACNQFDMYNDFKKDIKQATNYYFINKRFNDK